jgi:hypothetical protein
MKKPEIKWMKNQIELFKTNKNLAIVQAKFDQNVFWLNQRSLSEILIRIPTRSTIIQKWNRMKV